MIDDLADADSPSFRVTCETTWQEIIETASNQLRKRCATSWRDARDEIGAGWGLRVAVVVPGAVAGVEGACWGLACRPSSPGYSGPFRGRN
jgi:hypothetical protein